MNKKHLKVIPGLLYHETRRVLFNEKYIMETDVTNRCQLRCSYCYHFKYLDAVKEFQRYLEVTGQSADELVGKDPYAVKEFQRYIEVTGQDLDEWVKQYSGVFSFTASSVELLNDAVLKINKPEPSLDEWTERLNGAYEKGVRVVLFVGGEPALREDVLMVANEIFPVLAVISNGVKKIPEQFQHRIAVSLDGNREINDKLRGEGVFDKIMKNYQGDKRVVFNQVLTKQNYDNVSELVQTAKDADVAGVVFDLYTPGINEESEFILGKEEREKARALLHRELTKNDDMIFMTKQMIDWLLDGNHTGKCFWGDTVYHYDVYGNQRRCFNNFGDCSRCGCIMGSFQSFVWASAKSSKLRKFFLL